MCACVCAHLSACVYIHVCICVHVCVCARMCVNVQARRQAWPVLGPDPQALSCLLYCFIEFEMRSLIGIELTKYGRLANQGVPVLGSQACPTKPGFLFICLFV